MLVAFIFTLLLIYANPQTTVGWEWYYQGDSTCSKDTTPYPDYPQRVWRYYDSCIQESTDSSFEYSCVQDDLRYTYYDDPSQLCYTFDYELSKSFSPCRLATGGIDLYYYSSCDIVRPGIPEWYCDEIVFYQSEYDCMVDINPNFAWYFDSDVCTNGMGTFFGFYERFWVDWDSDMFTIYRGIYTDSTCGTASPVYTEQYQTYSPTCTLVDLGTDGVKWAKVKESECWFYCSECSSENCVAYEVCEGGEGDTSVGPPPGEDEPGAFLYYYDIEDSTCSGQFGQPPVIIDQSRRFQADCIPMDRFAPYMTGINEEVRRVIEQGELSGLRFDCDAQDDMVRFYGYFDPDCSGEEFLILEGPIYDCRAMYDGLYEVQYYVHSTCRWDTSIDFTKYVQIAAYTGSEYSSECSDYYFMEGWKIAFLEDTCLTGFDFEPGTSQKVSCHSDAAVFGTWDSSTECQYSVDETHIIERDECSDFTPENDPNPQYARLTSCKQDFCSLCVHGSCTSYEICECDEGWAGLGCDVEESIPVDAMIYLGKYLQMYSISDESCGEQPLVVMDNSHLYDECISIEDFLQDGGGGERRNKILRRLLEQTDDTIQGSMKFECDGEMVWTMFSENDCQGDFRISRSVLPTCERFPGAPMAISVSCSEKSITQSQYASLRIYTMNDPHGTPCNEEYVFGGITMGLLKSKCIPGIFNISNSDKVSCSGKSATIKQYDNTEKCAGSYKDYEVEKDECTDFNKLFSGKSGSEEPPMYGKLISCSFAKGGTFRTTFSSLLFMFVVLLCVA